MNKKGPLLIASNHPNSFLDAIILASIFKQPIYSLARGDAFVNKFVGRLLRSMNMLPVYRLSEGAHNLSSNYETFSACLEIFEKRGIVLIFSEGRCINEWHLRSLKKGTARLAITAWNKGIDLEVVPLGINYNSFRSLGKNVHLNFGNYILRDQFNDKGLEGKAIKEFNDKLNGELKDLVYEIRPEERDKRKELFEKRVGIVERIILFLPAMIGYVTIRPFYLIIRSIINNKAVDHYDSIVVGLLFIFYPIILLVIAFTCVIIFNNVWFWTLMLILPFTGWSYLQLKRQ
ncbi:MAG: hypothetical protein NVS3B19_20200 [Ginsengibacter sp.]